MNAKLVLLPPHDDNPTLTPETFANTSEWLKSINSITGAQTNGTTTVDQIEAPNG